METCRALGRDERGFIVSIELVLIATIVVIGLIAGLTALRDAIVSELADVASAVQDLNQSYSYNGAASNTAATAGADFIDQIDAGGNAADNCITVFGAMDEQ